MGILHSKKRSKSYDVAPVVSNTDFSYTKNPKPLPEIKLPAVAITLDEENAQNSTTSNEQANEVKPLEKNAGNSPLQTLDARIPSWINERNFKNVLTQLNPDFKEIVSFQANPAVAAGENYATLILRIQISIKLQDDMTKDLSFMLKVAHNNEEMKAMLQVMNFFLVENAVYADVIPAMEDMYGRAGVNITFGAKSHQLLMDETNIHYVLLDDLSLEGYKNANRLECLDMEHTLMVLRKLAQFHAASACHVANNGKFAELFSPDVDNEQARMMIGQMFMSFKKPFMDNLTTYDNFEIYYDAMDSYTNNLVNEFVSVRKPGLFNVLNHGDAWSNNILFSYTDDGKLKDARLVDFQNSNWGSPAQDIFYFIISSVQIDIKLSHFDYFVRYYHQQLTENLNLLKYSMEIPSLKEFHIQMIAYGSCATQTALFTLGIVLLEPTDNATFENFLGDSKKGVDLKNAMYSGQQYRKYMTEILPWLNNRGFMEVLNTNFDNETLSDHKLIPPTTTASALVEQKCEQWASSYPEWVNEALFVDVIRAEFKNYIKILKFTVSPTITAVENYLSIMLKVDIDIELTDNSIQNLSYMLKTPTNGEKIKTLVAMTNSFEKEVLAYCEILPQFLKIYKEQAKIDIIFGPKNYKQTKETDCDIIVLQNLHLKGFNNCDRLVGLDMKHTEAALKKLAQFHAASAYLFATKGNFSKVFERSNFTDETKDITENMGKILMACVDQYENNQEYFDKVRDYSENSTDYLIEALEIDWTKFNVLNHGDCSSNNILFQYDDKGEISNTCFVGYQSLRYCSPAYDLYYFLLSSPKLQLKLEQFDYFIRYYHECLTDHLQLLKYPNEIPSLKQLHMDLLDKGTFATFTAVCIMPVLLFDHNAIANLEHMMSTDTGGNEIKKQMFQNKRYRSHAEALFPWLNCRGLLNCRMELDIKSVTTTTCNVPSWVEAEHFKDILKEHLENFEKILNIFTAPATKSGDNFASNLLRVKVEAQLNDGTTESVSYILKLGLQTDSGSFSMRHFFDREIMMYSKYLREFEKMYRDAGKEYIFGPKYYSFKKDVGKEVLLLEDLRERNFKCGDRRKGLNIEHTQCVLRKLAQYHAASAKYFELNGPYPEIYLEALYTESDKDKFDDMKIDLEVYFKQYEGFEEYKCKLTNLFDNFVDHTIRASAITPTEFNVLNHGDSWLNNIMFKHNEEGQVDETYFVDFQVCKYGSPAQDLWYFLISSTELAIKVECFDYFVKYYHNNLLENLQLLKYSGIVPTLSELHTLMLKYGYIGFSTFIGVGAVSLFELGENDSYANNFAKTAEGDEFRNSLYLNDKYKANAAVVLPWLARRGCLD